MGIVKGNSEVLANRIYSQSEIHEKYGGVVPEIASRNHLQKFSPLLEQALTDVGISLSDLDVVGTTYGPGLVGPLLVGLSLGKSLAYSLEIPFFGINHLEAHIFAHYASDKVNPPFIALLVSGGHTSLILVNDWGKYKRLGETRDDAAGEAFDKVGYMTDLGYPAGPTIDKISKKGDPERYAFPRPMLDSGLDFSFAGLKSAVYRQVKESYDLPDLLASFQEAAVDTLVGKALQAAKEQNVNHIAVMGGVSANSRLREMLTKRAKNNGMTSSYPPLELCTDNGAMIAITAAFKFKNSLDPSPLKLGPKPSLNLG